MPDASTIELVVALFHHRDAPHTADAWCRRVSGIKWRSGTAMVIVRVPSRTEGCASTLNNREVDRGHPLERKRFDAIVEWIAASAPSPREPTGANRMVTGRVRTGKLSRLPSTSLRPMQTGEAAPRPARPRTRSDARPRPVRVLPAWCSGSGSRR